MQTLCFPDTTVGINQLTDFMKARYNNNGKKTMHLLLSRPQASVSCVFLCQALFQWLLSESHHSGRMAQNSPGWGRPAGLACGLLSCSVSKPSAGLWNGGSFLMHASGQSRAYTPSTISVLWLFFIFSLSFCPSFLPSLSHTQLHFRVKL